MNLRSKPSFFHTYIPLNRVSLSSRHLIKNYRYLSSHGKTVAPVLKSNAYGHGIREIARILDPLKPPFFCVDSLYEAYQLYTIGIQTQILIMGYVHPTNLSVKKLPFTYAIFSKEMLESVRRFQPHAPVHIFIDTGMHREGLDLNDLPRFLELSKSYGVHIDGIMTHLAMADKPHNAVTKKQCSVFQRALQILSDKSITPRYVHFGSSGVAMHTDAFPFRHSTVRSGLALYGVDPTARDKNLLPVLSLTTTVVQTKRLEKYSCVGYDCTYTVKKPSIVAVLPIGYNDGVDRRLSNRGSVIFKKTYCPIIGRISMNITTVDISNVPNVRIGDSVTVYSDNPKAQNSITRCASVCKTIPYDLFVHIHPSIHRDILT